jgi:Ser/Thr protein kinase RdoA (MazF antagonist)
MPGEMKLKGPTDDHLRKATKLWGFNSPCTLIRHVANFVYRAERGGKHLVLRLTDDSHRSEKQVHAELEWVNHLAMSGLGVAGPVPSLDGRLVTEISDGQQCFLASAFHFAPGLPIKGVDSLAPRLIEAWARTLGRFHTLSFPSGSSRSAARPMWRNEPVLQGVLDAIAGGGIRPDAQLDAALSWMEKLGQEKDAFGLVHADLHMGNFFVDHDGRMTVFDFDDCCFHWFGYDSAVSVVSASFAAMLAGIGGDVEDVAEMFMMHYARERPWSEDDFERLLKFARFRIVLMTLWGHQQKALGTLDTHALSWCAKFEEWGRLCFKKLPLFG